MYYLCKQKQAGKKQSESIKYNCCYHSYSNDKELVQALRFHNDLYSKILSSTVLFPHVIA